MHEVVERGDGTIGSALEATRPELTWGFVKTFELLHRVVDELRRDRSLTKLAQAVTMYHFVVEATLAQPGPALHHRLPDRARRCSPASARACATSRSTSSATSASACKLLRDLAREDPEVPEAVAEQLRKATPLSLAVFVPPGWDERYVECFGFTLEQVYEEGARSFEAKFKAAGPAGRVAPRAAGHADGHAAAPSARGAGIAMLRAGYLGERNGPAGARPGRRWRCCSTACAAASTRATRPRARSCSSGSSRTPSRGTCGVDNGATAAAPGRAPHVDLELQCRFDDWVDVVAGRLDPRKAVATGRLRPRGTPRTLWRARGLISAS